PQTPEMAILQGVEQRPPSDGTHHPRRAACRERPRRPLFCVMRLPRRASMVADRGVRRQESARVAGRESSVEDATLYPLHSTLSTGHLVPVGEIELVRYTATAACASETDAAMASPTSEQSSACSPGRAMSGV